MNVEKYKTSVPELSDQTVLAQRFCTSQQKCTTTRHTVQTWFESGLSNDPFQGGDKVAERYPQGRRLRTYELIAGKVEHGKSHCR
eukprot:3323736-Ditylum_brightwellii.AAC.1